MQTGSRSLPQLGGRLMTGVIKVSPHAALLAASYGVGKRYNTEFNKAMDIEDKANIERMKSQSDVAVMNRNREILAGKHDWRYTTPAQKQQLEALKARLRGQPIVKNQPNDALAPIDRLGGFSRSQPIVKNQPNDALAPIGGLSSLGRSKPAPGALMAGPANVPVGGAQFGLSSPNARGPVQGSLSTARPASITTVGSVSTPKSGQS